MPIFEFYCPECGYECEEIRKIDEKIPPVCQHDDPHALENNTASYMVKKFPTKTSFILKGSTWARDGYNGKTNK